MDKRETETSQTEKEGRSIEQNTYSRAVAFMPTGFSATVCTCMQQRWELIEGEREREREGRKGGRMVVRHACHVCNDGDGDDDGDADSAGGGRNVMMDAA
jgi:hypothetical protein